MVERFNPDKFYNVSLNSRQVGELEEALASQGFEALTKFPGMTLNNDVPDVWKFYRDKNGLSVLIESVDGEDSHAVEYSHGTAPIVEDVLRNP